MGKKLKISILGASSHIAKGLILNFSKFPDYELFLFARSVDSVDSFIKENNIHIVYRIDNFERLYDFNYDCIINCIGIGRNSDIRNVFDLTEYYDNLIINYLQKHKDCFYINFSSGAVYRNYDTPSDENSLFSLNINKKDTDTFYSIAKINSEIKHRAYYNLNIVDLRVFSYFSRFIDLESGYLITEIIKAIKQNKEFKTTSKDIIRDFSDPSDLFNLILKCIYNGNMNDVFDVYSKKPVSKFEMLEYYKKSHGLRYNIDDNILIHNFTGDKNIYFSKYHKAKLIGFEPEYNSLQTIDKETKMILNK